MIIGLDDAAMRAIRENFSPDVAAAVAELDDSYRDAAQLVAIAAFVNTTEARGMAMAGICAVSNEAFRRAEAKRDILELTTRAGRPDQVVQARRNRMEAAQADLARLRAVQSALYAAFNPGKTWEF